MEKEEQQLRHRLSELASLCFYRNIPLYSDFLTLKEQEIFQFLPREFSDVSYTLEGGFPDAERKAACFLPAESADHMEAKSLFQVLKISPISEKFASDCSHRDFLGAILNLGIERGKIGDLIVSGNSCYAVCIPPIGDFLCQELSFVKHNPVICRETSWDQISCRPSYSEIRGTVASLRLDAAVSLCCSVSRSRAAELCKGERVFVNGSCVTSVSFVPKEGQVISVRGFGKFRFEKLENQTRKGRLLLLFLRYE